MLQNIPTSLHDKGHHLQATWICKTKLGCCSKEELGRSDNKKEYHPCNNRAIPKGTIYVGRKATALNYQPTSLMLTQQSLSRFHWAYRTGERQHLTNENHERLPKSHSLNLQRNCLTRQYQFKEENCNFKWLLCKFLQAHKKSLLHLLFPLRAVFSP